MSDALKAQFLKRVDAWPTATIEVRGITLTIQALTRDQAMKMSTFDSPAEREAFMISTAVIEPFTLSADEVQLLRENSEALDIEALGDTIVELSGLGKKAKEAQTAAFKSVRSRSGS
ncbi:MAG TPA: hypothetical protein VK878_23195 [Candidatus Deferrimicrobiaceae bacterium]|nr:hypothetical protein [Candidatus Deferrimicrobiaceae bacterium]